MFDGYLDIEYKTLQNENYKGVEIRWLIGFFRGNSEIINKIYYL